MSRTELIVVRPDRPRGLVARVRDAVRSSWSGPITSKSPELAKYFGGSGPTQSGVSVNEESALTASPVWSAVTMISDDIASLPLHLYKRSSGGGKERYDSHQLYRILHDAPNPEMDSMVMRRVMQTHLLLWQNAYAEIERDGAGRPVAIWPLCPEYVTPFREGGALRYRYQAEGSPVVFEPADMIHLVGHGHDGTVGSSMVQKARESIGMVLAAEKFGASFFGNGATFGGVISYKGAKPPELSEKGYRDTLNARHAGVQRAYGILSLYNDAKYESIGVSPDEGQFNETRVFQIREVARWFKMPPHKLGDLADATYSNVEQMDAAYMSSCIRPWLVLWQQQLSRKLISPLERTQQFIEHDTHGFLSVDAAARAALYASEFATGGLKPNEERSYENRNPVDGGEDTFIQTSMIPLAMARPWWQAQIDEKKAQIEKLKQPPPPPAPAADPAKDETIASQGRKIQELADANELLKAALDESRVNATAMAQQADAFDDARLAAIAARDAAIQRADETEVQRAAEIALSTTIRAERQAEGLAHGAALETLNSIRRSEVFDRDMTIATLAGERDEARAALSHVQELLDGATSALVAEQAERARELAERNVAIVERDDAAGARIMAETEATLATQRAEQAERDRDIATQAQQAANTALEEIRAREVKRLSDVVAAHRALMVDAMGRMVQWETDKARRNQTTPEKLRHWVTAFYQEHEHRCVDALLPAVTVHLAWSQSADDPATVTRQMVREHVAESVRQLRAVVDGDPDDLHVSLERMLQRWEKDRAAALADQLLRKEIDHVRSL